MEYYYDQHIGVYKNAFPDEWCDRIVEYYNLNLDQFVSRKSLQVKDTHGHLRDKDLANEFLSFFNPCFDLYSEKYPQIPQPLEVVGWKIQKTLNHKKVLYVYFPQVIPMLIEEILLFQEKNT